MLHFVGSFCVFYTSLFSYEREGSADLKGFCGLTKLHGAFGITGAEGER